MKILFLTTQLPYPPVSGGVIKSWRLVEHWAQKYELRIVCGLKNEDAQNLEAFRRKVKGVEVFGHPLGRERSALNLLKSYISAPSLNVYRNASPEIADRVKQWASDSDIIFVDHYEMGQYIPERSKAKVVLHEHNAEYVMWKRLGEIENSPFKKLALTLEAKRIARAERIYADKADAVLAAPNDIEELVKVGVDRQKCQLTYHLGEDEMLDLASIRFDETEKSLLFVGTLTWEANVDGLLWFFDEVWPRLLEKQSNIRFYILGKNPDPRLQKVADEDSRIMLKGFVKDLEPYHRKARVFVIPLRFGSGIKVKLLHAMYRGIPVVTTPIGTEGLEVASGEHLFSSLDPEEQAEHISRLLEEPKLWEEMQAASRRLVRRYTWKALLAEHDSLLEGLSTSKH